ncbi:MAG: hypothetical protein AW07_01192 [Candidatus Accumulibacter sp. SK-11]|nr:MAG: hypothetical protein AW07_01192 [Candidatus Accumulibacter sp. SK-11]
MQQPAQRVTHLYALGAQLRRLAARQVVGVEALDLGDVGGAPGALQAGGERRLEAADAFLEDASDPAADSRLIAHQPRLDRPLETLRIGVGAHRQGRTGELQQARQREVHLNS